MEIKNKTTNTVELQAAPGMVLRRKGYETEGQRMATVVRTDAENWEEIEETPGAPYTREEYREEVQRLVAERYDPSREAGIVREALAAMRPTAQETPEAAVSLAVFEEYNAYVEGCKARAIATLEARAAEPEAAENM